MKNSITRNCVVPLPYIRKPTDLDAYVIVAHDLFQGVEVLSTAQNIVPRSCALLAAHVLECTLKAFLVYVYKENKRTLRGHDLLKLWNMACEKGLNIPKEPPDWVKILASGHGSNYYLRYQEGKDHTIVNGGETPALVPMVVELKKLIELVKLAIKT